MASAQTQGELWGARADDWAAKAEPTTAPLWEALLAACEVGRGTRLLDLGCGGGGLATLAAAAGASVSGIDASENLVAIARRRLPSSDFRVGDLESLPFSDASFDVVTATNSLQFVDDRAAALAEARRVLSPGGRLGVGMWAEPERCDMSAVFGALGRVMAQGSGGAHEPPTAPTMSDRSVLVGLIESGGFAIERVEDIECLFEFSDGDEAWSAIGSAGMVVAAARAAGEETVKSAVLDALSPFADPSGRIQMSNWFRYVVGR